MLFLLLLLYSYHISLISNYSSKFWEDSIEASTREIFNKREVVVAKEKIFASLLGFFALPLSLGVSFFLFWKNFAVVEVVIDWLYWIFIEPLMLGHEYAYFLMFAILYMVSMLIVGLKYKVSLIHALLIVILTIVFIRLEIEVWSYFISFNQNRVNNF